MPFPGQEPIIALWKTSPLKTAILLPGGDLAGLCAALAAHEQGARVTIAAKGKVGRSGKVIAKDGPAAVLSGGTDGDSEARHAQNTMRSGGG